MIFRWWWDHQEQNESTVFNFNCNVPRCFKIYKREGSRFLIPYTPSTHFPRLIWLIQSYLNLKLINIIKVIFDNVAYVSNPVSWIQRQEVLWQAVRPECSYLNLCFSWWNMNYLVFPKTIKTLGQLLLTLKFPRSLSFPKKIDRKSSFNEVSCNFIKI